MLARRLVPDGTPVGAAVTVVVACVDPDAGRVHMAADSLAVDGNGNTVEITKIVQPAPGVLVGVAGYMRAIPIIRRHVRIDPPADDDDIDEWAQDYAEAATVELVARGCAQDDDSNRFYGDLLLAYGDGLWEIETGMACRITRDYHAIGSGYEVAFGAMWAMQDLPPAIVPGLAIEACMEHLAGIGGTVLGIST